MLHMGKRTNESSEGNTISICTCEIITERRCANANNSIDAISCDDIYFYVINNKMGFNFISNSIKNENS